MKNSEIIALVEAGCLISTNHSLLPAHAYKVFKFKKELDKAFNAYRESEAALLKECGIDDPNKFDTTLSFLRSKGDERTEEENISLKEAEAMLDSYRTMREQLYNEDVVLDVKAMPYEEWKKLQDENKDVVNYTGKHLDVFSGHTEFILEGILWSNLE